MTFVSTTIMQGRPSGPTGVLRSAKFGVGEPGSAKRGAERVRASEQRLGVGSWPRHGLLERDEDLAVQAAPVGGSALLEAAVEIVRHSLDRERRHGSGAAGSVM